jgi:alpha-1,6-mannosyltransferase
MKREQNMGYLEKSLPWLQRHALLLVTGIGCELVYLFYFVRQFPLTQYYQELIDVGGITHHSPTGFMLFVVALTLAFALFGLALWRTFARHSRGTLWLVLSFGALFAFTMAFVYPGTAIDIFSYIAQSIILLQHHANPMVTPALSFPNDPLMGLAGGLGSRGTPYGPLAILIDAVPTLIVGRNVLANLLLLKLQFSVMLLVEAYLAYCILKRYAPDFALPGALFIAWNPFMLFDFGANGHNDVIVMLFVLLAVLALVEEHSVLAFALIIASVLTKYTTVLLVPLFLLHGIIYQPRHHAQLMYLLKVICVSLLLVAIFYGPFWSSTRIFDSLLSEDQYYISSFSTMLFEITSPHVPLEQGKILGRVVFVLLYLYALFLSTRNTPTMLRGCFLALFFFLAFGTPKFQIWYAIWPAALAAVTPRRAILATAFLFTYGAMLSNCVYQFLFPMLGPTVDDGFMFSHALAYLIVFMSSLLLLSGISLKTVLSLRGRQVGPACNGTGQVSQEALEQSTLLEKANDGPSDEMQSDPDRV